MSEEFSERHIERFWQQARYGDYRGALDSIRAALGVEPSNGYFHSLLAWVLLKLKRRHAALHEAKLGVSMEPESAFPHFVRGLVEEAFQRHSAAIDAVRQAIALEPEDPDYHAALGAIHAAGGQREQAVQALEHALWLNGEHTGALAELGDLYRDAADYAKAEQYYRSALTIAPQHQDALIGLGHLALKDGRIDEARDHAIWVLQQNADDAKALHLMTAIKARTNPFLGAWWRMNAWANKKGPTRLIVVLLAGYVLFQLASLLLRDAGKNELAQMVSYAWIALVVYSWIGPIWFKRMLEKELRTVELKPGF